MTARSSRPCEKCQDRARRAAVVSKVEVIAAWVVKIDRAFYKSQSHDPGVEIQVLLGVRRDCGNVVQSNNRGWHRSIPPGVETWIRGATIQKIEHRLAQNRGSEQESRMLLNPKEQSSNSRDRPPVLIFGAESATTSDTSSASNIR